MFHCLEALDRECSSGNCPQSAEYARTAFNCKIVAAAAAAAVVVVVVVVLLVVAAVVVVIFSCSERLS